MSALLRSAGKADADAVARVHATSRRAYYAAGGLEIPLKDSRATDEYRAFWSQTLANEANRGWIAEGAPGCVGFLVAGDPIHEDLVGTPVVELIGLYLLPEVWGTGIAGALHERFVRLLMATPTAKAGALDVWSGNKRAVAFYRRHRWSPDSRSRPGPAGQLFVGFRLAIPIEI